MFFANKRRWRRLLPVASLLMTIVICGRPPTVSAQNGTVTLRIGYMGLFTPAFGTSALAAHLIAVDMINSNPSLYLGNASFRVESAVADEYYPFGHPTLIQGVRSMMRLTGRSDCYTPLPGPQPVLMPAVPADVHVVVQGGFSNVVQATGHISEFGGKPVVSFGATDVALSDKTVYPTVSRISSPDSEEAFALAAIAHSLGVVRVGIIYSTDDYGMSMERRFNASCAQFNITVAGTVSVPSGMYSMTPAKQAQVGAEAATALQTVFVNGNIRVYLMAVSVSDATTIMPTIAQVGLLGPGNLPLLPSTYVLLATLNADIVANDVSRFLLHGSIGIFSNTDPVEEGKLWAAWPKNGSDWAALLATSAQTANLSSIPPPIPVRQAITAWAHSAYDGTIFAAKAMAAAWEACQSSSAGTLDLSCALNFVRNTTISGTSGNITLNNVGDRVGYFGVFNIVNKTRQYLGMAYGDRSPQFSVPSMVWSDGTTGRSTAPAWGQEPPPATAAPTVAPAVTNTDRDRTAMIISVVLAGILFLLAIGATLYHIQERRRQRRPADFRKVIAALREEIDAFDFRAREGVTDEGRVADNGLIRMASTTTDSGLNLPVELKRRDVLIKGEIGQGNFGRVCRGKLAMTVGKAKTQVNVAIKMVEESSESQKAFLDEAVVSWQFEHPNVVGMYGVVTSGLPNLLVLELCEGGELLKFVQAESERPVDLLLSILKDISAGMRYLASKNFVHRDVAARNVLLDQDQRAKMCDFGLGRNFDNDYYRVSTETMLPIRWTDPWAIEHQVFSEATDVWSFGVTAVEIFTKGARPYGNWPNLVVLESIKSGHRLEKPETMPAAVYTNVVLPCWKVNSEAVEQMKPNDKTTRSFTSGMYSERATFAEIDEVLQKIVDDDALQEEEVVSRQELSGLPPQSQNESRNRVNEYVAPSERVAGSLYAVTTLNDDHRCVNHEPEAKNPENERLLGSYVMASDTTNTESLYAQRGSKAGGTTTAPFDGGIEGEYVMPEGAQSSDLYALRQSQASASVRDRKSVKQIPFGNKYATIRQVDLLARAPKEMHELVMDHEVSDLRLTDITNRGFTLYVSPHPVKEFGGHQALQLNRALADGVRTEALTENSITLNTNPTFPRQSSLI